MSSEPAVRKLMHGGREGRGSVLASFPVCLALTLVAPSASAFRTSEDSPELAGKGRVGWGAAPVPFLISEQSLPEGLGKDEIEQALLRSVESWGAPECSTIEPFLAGWTKRAPEPMDGENTISWVDDWGARGLPESAPGSTDVQYRGQADEWRIAETDIYLNASDFDWSSAGGEGTSVEAVLTHELGHALGLLHPCEPGGEEGAPDCDGASDTVAATTMYPFYDVAQASLAADDVEGICYLYPTGEECGPCERDETCVDGECRTTCRDGICRAGEVCGFWGCIEPDSCLLRDCTGQPCDAKQPTSCGPLAACQNDVCVKGGANWGDSCARSADCSDGACVEGVCQPDCVTDGECGRWGQCTPAVEGNANGCVSSGAYERGMRCAAGEDCSSGICIFTDGRNSCTTACDSSDSCPSEWSCKRVDKKDVCVPPAFEPSGGCSVSNDVGQGQGPLGWWVALAVLAQWKRRKRNAS